MSQPNLKAEVVLEWGDGSYLFALKVAQIEELEKLLDEGIGNICFRVFSGTQYSYKHLRETIRLGLIGGGMSPVEAKRKVEAYVDGRPLDNQADEHSTYKTARAVLQAVFFGFEDLPPGEARAGMKSPAKSTSANTEPSSSKPE